MDIRFSCPRCDQSLSVEERGAGMLVNCPNCNEQIEIPRARMAIHFACSYCTQIISVDESKAREKVECPHCNFPVKVPAKSTDEPPLSPPPPQAPQHRSAETLTAADLANLFWEKTRSWPSTAPNFEQ